MKIISINDTKFDSVVLNVQIDDETTLPVYITDSKWAKTKSLNSLEDRPDAIVIDADIRFGSYTIVAVGDEWTNDKDGTTGVYDKPKIMAKGNINIELDTAVVITVAKNKALLKLVDERIESKIEEQLAAQLDTFF